MKPLAGNPLSMPSSGIRKIMNLALTMEDVLHLEVGEPDFQTPPHIVEAGHLAAKDGYTKYTANAGLLSVRQTLAEKIRRVNGFEVAPERITISCGAVSALMAAVAGLVEAGDEVLIPDPGWPNYEMMILTVGGTPVRYPLDPAQGFLPEIDAIESRITPKTKAIFLNTPGNPTGAVFPEETVRAILALADRYDLWVISDEVYEQIIFAGEHVGPARFDTRGRVVSVYSFSKTYAMTGWRVGYMVTPPPLTDVVNKLQEAFISCASAVSQMAARAAILAPQDCVEEMRQVYQRRRDLAVSLLKEYDMFTYVPRGAFYAMVDISRATDDTYGFATRLLQEHRVAVAPGETFGESGRGYIRIALCAADETIREGLSRIARAVSSYR